MTVERLDELAILNSLGALDGDDLKEFNTFLTMADETMLKRITAWDETAVLLASSSPMMRRPSMRVKDRLMRKVQERHATERAIEGPGTARFDHAQGIYTIFPERLEWSKHPVDGVQFKVLTESEKRGYVTMLMKVEPGVVFPEHHHSAEEECYVLSGSIILNGKKLGPGVLHHGDEDSGHGILTSDEGALLFLVVAKEDYIPSV